MKTLDEVIEELNIWDAYGDEYPDVFYDTQTIMDALHYLKEYRKHLIQDLDELRQKKYELEINMKLDALLQENPWEKRK